MRETDAEFGAAHDRWLAGYSKNSHAEVWCENKDCANHEGVTVTYESEYGAGWYTPEECWICGGDWLDVKPEQEE